MLMAAPAICICLTACRSQAEKYASEIAELQIEVAEILLDCEDQDDIDKAAEKISELAEEADELVKEMKSAKLELEEEEKNMSRRASRELEQKLSVKVGKASALMEDGILHVMKIEGVKQDELQKALEKFGKAFSDM